MLSPVNCELWQILFQISPFLFLLLLHKYKPDHFNHILVFQLLSQFSISSYTLLPPTFLIRAITLSPLYSNTFNISLPTEFSARLFYSVTRSLPMKPQALSAGIPTTVFRHVFNIHYVYLGMK